MPFKALLLYAKQVDKENTQQEKEVYVESYDIGRNGSPVNAHPLSLKESIVLAEVLQSGQEMQNGFLKCRGVLPNNLLYVNSDKTGYAVWHTPPMERGLFFVKGLGIPSGKMNIPAMVWKAGRDNLQVFAIRGSRKPQIKTTLYHAPYFNIYPGGAVCMGNVHIKIDRNTYLEDFIAQWERYFFESYFSHTLNGGSQVKGNIVQLWKGQAGTGQKFPEACLVKNGLTIEKVIR